MDDFLNRNLQLLVRNTQLNAKHWEPPVVGISIEIAWREILNSTTFNCTQSHSYQILTLLLVSSITFSLQTFEQVYGQNIILGWCLLILEQADDEAKDFEQLQNVAIQTSLQTHIVCQNFSGQQT